MWDAGENPDSWKDFVELAKAAGASFLTMNDWVLERDEADELLERLRSTQVADDEHIEDARWLFAYQGTMFLYEIFTEWYERYQHLVEVADEFGGIVIDETDQDDEH